MKSGDVMKWKGSCVSACTVDVMLQIELYIDFTFIDGPLIVAHP